MSPDLCASFAFDMFCFTFSTAFCVSCSVFFGLLICFSEDSLEFCFSTHIKKRYYRINL